MELENTDQTTDLGVAACSLTYHHKLNQSIRLHPMGHEKEKKEKEKKKHKSDSNIEFMFKKRTLIRLIKFSGKHTIFLICYIVFTFVSTVYRVKTPIFAGKIVDAIILENAEDVIEELIYDFLEFVVISIISHFLSTLSQNLLRETIYLKLKQASYESFVNKDIEYVEAKGAIKIFWTLEKDLQIVSKQATFITFMEIFSELYTNFVRLYQLFEISFGLTMCLVVTIPLFSVVIRKYSKYMKTTTLQIDKNTKESAHFFSQTASNFNVVKSNSQESEFISKFEHILKQSFALTTKRSLLEASHKVMNMLIQRIGEVIVLIYGAKLLMSNQITPGKFSTFVINCNALANITKVFSDHVNSISKAGLSCKRFFEFLDYKPKIEWNAGIILDKLEGYISFEGVKFAYPARPDFPVILNAQFEVRCKSSVAIVGHSGSGKSSFMKLLLRMYDPTEGAITIDGYNLKKLNLKWLHDHIGYVSPESVLLPGTLEEVLTFGVKNYKHEELLNCCKMTGAIDIVKKFRSGLMTKIGDKGMRLSSGERQKIFITRALLKKPKILIFDDATAMLDPQSELQVQKTIDKLIEEKQCTIVLIGNQLRSVKACETIITMKNGEIVEIGNHDFLMSQGGLYQKMYLSQRRSRISSVIMDELQSPPPLRRISSRKQNSIRR